MVQHVPHTKGQGTDNQNRVATKYDSQKRHELVRLLCTCLTVRDGLSG